MKKWNGPIKPTYLELPEDLHHEMRALGLRTGRKAADMYAAAASLFLDRGVGSTAYSDLPDLGMAGLPDRVVQVLRTHADDPRLLECIFAICDIWDIGNGKVQEAITSNCRVFTEASAAMGNRIARASNGTDYEKRVDALLGDEARIDQEIDSAPQSDSDTRAGRGHVRAVGEKPPRKKRRG